MPLYDFLCRTCGETFEAQVPVGHVPGCPHCGGEDTERRLSPFAGPFRVGLRGAAARRSNAERSAREAQRREQRAQRRDRAGEG